VPDLPPEPAAEDLPALVAALRAANARLREVIEAKDAQLAAAGAALVAAEARFAALSERVAELERRLGKDSSASSRPPSSDSPYKKKRGWVSGCAGASRSGPCQDSLSIRSAYLAVLRVFGWLAFSPGPTGPRTPRS
jgi:hypothetical protein